MGGPAVGPQQQSQPTKRQDSGVWLAAAVCGAVARGSMPRMFGCGGWWSAGAPLRARKGQSVAGAPNPPCPTCPTPIIMCRYTPPRRFQRAAVLWPHELVSAGKGLAPPLVSVHACLRLKLLQAKSCRAVAASV